MIKLTNLWENFNLVIDKIKNSDNKKIRTFIYKINEIYPEQHFKNVIKLFISEIQESNELLDIFDYNDSDKIQLLSFINNNTIELLVDFVSSKLDGTINNSEMYFDVELYDKSKFKITTTSEKLHKTEVIKFYCNGVEILTYRKSRELYAKIVKGVPSNLRTESKPYNILDFNKKNLIELFPDGNHQYIRSLRSSNPDLTWGYTGPSKPTINQIHNTLKTIYEF